MQKRYLTFRLMFAVTAIVGAVLSNMSYSAAAELRAFVKDQKGQPVEDAVVLAVPLDEKNKGLFKPPLDTVDQIDKDFIPHVKVVTPGTNVSFPNKDNVRHHVYSFSPAKTFELPLYSGTPAKPVHFDKTGQVTLGCNIHDWMLGYVYVADTPFFGKSLKDGKILIADAPAGEYSVRVWHPDMKGTEEATARKVMLSDAKSASMEWQITLKPVFKIPRASGGSGGGYR